MKKIRVDFVAHQSVVVAVKETEDMYEVAEQIAQVYIENSPSVHPTWEVEDGGVDDADEDADVDVAEMFVE